jgi:hypothetical protein
MPNPPIQPSIIPTPPTSPPVLPVMPPRPPVAPPPPKKKSFAWLLILVILFLLASTGVLAYQYYQLKTQTTKPTSSPSLTPISTPLVSPQPSAEADDPTANWKIYNNTSYSFRIDYPVRFEIVEKTKREDCYDTLATLTSPLKESITLRAIHDIDIYEKNGPEMVAEREVIDSGFIYNITTTKIGDYFAAITTFDNNPDKKFPTITIAHPNKNLFIVIDINTDLSRVEFDQILATFKFTD